MLTKDGKDIDILKLTAENYAVPIGEETIFHTRIEVKKFDPNTGERQSRPRIQKFGIKMFETTVRSELLKQGFTIDILHDPKKWLKEKAELDQAAADEKKLNAKRAKASQKSALKKEILEELKNENQIINKTK